VVAGLVAVVIGGWVFAALYLSAGDRIEVVAMASSVQRHDRIDRSDLRVVRVGMTGERVSVVPSSELDGLVGGVTSSDLATGTLLAPGQIANRGERILAHDEAVVSIVVPAGNYPSGQQQGDEVLLVIRPKDGDRLPVTELDGWVFRPNGDPMPSGDLAIEVAVDRTQAAGLTVAAADGRVTFVAFPDEFARPDGPAQSVAAALKETSR
jgi:hypothetical protein